MENQLKRNAEDKVFKNLLENRENLAQFYYDLTGKQIDPDQIIYDTITTNLVREKENITFHIGSEYIILFEPQSTWKKEDIIPFTAYMCLIFVNFMEEHKKEIFENNEEITIPSIEAYVIYTGNEKLPEAVNLDELYPAQDESMIEAQVNIVTSENAKGMVKEYIQFDKLEAEYYSKNKRTRNDILELIDYCIKNNILKDYILKNENKVTDLIEKIFRRKTDLGIN